MNLTLALTLVFYLSVHAIKGLAFAVNVPQDLIILNAEAWLNWSESGQTPMVYGVPNKCYAVMIVSNEPNAITPYGTNQTPRQYGDLVTRVRQKCPLASLVIGNVSVEDWRHIGGQKRGAEWLAELLPMVHDENYSIGAHCYSSSAAWCIAQLAEIERMTKRDLWVTEYGVTTGDPSQMYKLMRWIDRNAVAGYAYTNRQPSQCGQAKQGWEINNGVNLVNCDGSPTPSGKVFAEWKKHASNR